MINLREFRRKPDRLSDYLMWAAMIAPGVILNKDGSLQASFKYRGPDLDSATQGELVSVTARVNNALKRLSGGWAVYAEAQRIKSRVPHVKAAFPDPVTERIDAERRNYFSEGNHYESVYYFTLVYLPPAENQDKLQKVIMEGDKDAKAESVSGTEHLKYFLAEADRVFNLFKEVMWDAEPLTDEETLTYLHSCISPKQHLVKVPEIPMYLDAYLVDSPLTGGLKPMLGDHHLRIVSVLGFPGTSIPGILDGLNQLNFEYRWVTRFIALDKNEAKEETEKYRRLWFAKRKSMFTVIKEMLTQEESVMVDDDALEKSEDSAMASAEVASDIVSYGYYTIAVVVVDKDKQQAEKKAQAVEKTINSIGYTAVIETLNAVDAWFSSIPSMCRSNVRRPLVNTINLAHMFPLSAIWAGPERNKHLNGPVLLHTETRGNTPFRLDLHVGDVGHTMLIGPTGAGKSVHLALLAGQFRKYKDAQVYFFDKGGSCRALTAAVGGNFYDLASESNTELSFQPLAGIDDENERSWAAEWIYDFLRGENVEIVPEHKKAVWTALSSLANSPVEQRTITGLTLLLQDQKLSAALTPLTLEGSFGRLFDSKVDTFSYSKWQVFEMETIMNTPAAVAPTLSYLFHKLEQRFTGAPTLLILDESWIFFDNAVFAAKIREWLKVLRKANVSVVFATQTLQDVANSTIAPAILDSCPTRIFLPNTNAMDERVAKTYYTFGLNDREIEIIATATPKRHYYYKSIMGSRLYELALGPLTLAYCAASSKEDQKMIRQILSEHGKEGFNSAWLKYKNVSATAEFA